MKILSVIIEGGARLIQSFIDEGIWDEARVITNTKMLATENSIPSPILIDSKPVFEEFSFSDMIRFYHPV